MVFGGWHCAGLKQRYRKEVYMKSWMFFVGVIMAISSARADMYSALQRVYDTNPVIAEQRQIVSGAAADVDLARSGYKPFLGVGAGIGAARSQLFGDTYNYVPTQIGAEFEQNLFAGGATLAQIKAAKGLHESQVAVLYSTQQDVFLDAINAYINVLNAAEVLKLNENNMRVLDEYYDYVKGRADVGMLTKTDVASAAARRSGAKYSVVNARASYDNSLETFRRIYGTTDEDFTEINTNPVRDAFPDSVDAAERAAMQTHPALIALDAQEVAARENITVARKTRMPSVDVKASIMQMDDLPIVDRVRDGRVGVYLTVPLYDKGAASARVEKGRFTVASIQDKIINTRRVISENLHQAWNVYDAQTVAIDAAGARVDAAKLALNGIRAEQKSGRRTVLDVLDAEQELLNAQVELTRARHAKVSAYFAILAAVGRLSAENLGLNTSDD